MFLKEYITSFSVLTFLFTSIGLTFPTTSQADEGRWTPPTNGIRLYNDGAPLFHRTSQQPVVIDFAKKQADRKTFCESVRTDLLPSLQERLNIRRTVTVKGIDSETPRQITLPGLRTSYGQWLEEASEMQIPLLDSLKQRFFRFLAPNLFNESFYHKAGVGVGSGIALLGLVVGGYKFAAGAYTLSALLGGAVAAAPYLLIAVIVGGVIYFGYKALKEIGYLNYLQTNQEADKRAIQLESDNLEALQKERIHNPDGSLNEFLSDDTDKQMVLRIQSMHVSSNGDLVWSTHGPESMPRFTPMPLQFVGAKTDLVFKDYEDVYYALEQGYRHFQRAHPFDEKDPSLAQVYVQGANSQYSIPLRKRIADEIVYNLEQQIKIAEGFSASLQEFCHLSPTTVP